MNSDKLSSKQAYGPAHARQRGQATVEIAFLLPVLLILLLGILMAGFTFYAFIQVSNAAREGARAGSLWRITNTESGLTLDQTVKRAIYDSSASPPRSALGFLSPTGASFNVNSDVVSTWADVDGDGNVSAGDTVSSAVTYRYTIPIVSVLLPMFPQPITIVRTVQMEIQ